MNLTNQFLIAMPALADPNFNRTVTYMCTHNEDGAMGIVINRPSELTLGEVFEHMSIATSEKRLANTPVLQGGPVRRERGFVLHEPPGDWDSVLKVSSEIGIATSRDILTALASGEGPAQSLVALGYAGWGAGQLEREVLENAWLSGPADRSIIFDTPFEQRWERAASLLGVDVRLLSGDAGHA